MPRADWAPKLWARELIRSGQIGCPLRLPPVQGIDYVVRRVQGAEGMVYGGAQCAECALPSAAGAWCAVCRVWFVWWCGLGCSECALCTVQVPIPHPLPNPIPGLSDGTKLVGEQTTTYGTRALRTLHTVHHLGTALLGTSQHRTMHWGGISKEGEPKGCGSYRIHH